MCGCPEDLWSKDLEATIVEDTILQREETVQKWQVCQQNSFQGALQGTIKKKKKKKKKNLYIYIYIYKNYTNKIIRTHLCRANYRGPSHN